MKLTHLTTAAAAIALLGGAAYAQQAQPSAAQYQDKSADPSGQPPSDTSTPPPDASAPSGQQPPSDTSAPPPDTSAPPSPDASAPPSPDSSAAPPPDTSASPPPDASAAPPPDTGASPPSGTAADTSATAGSAAFANLTVTNGPVPDTAENRKKYGQPVSHRGKRSAAKGN